MQFGYPGPARLPGKSSMHCDCEGLNSNHVCRRGGSFDSALSRFCRHVAAQTLHDELWTHIATVTYLYRFHARQKKKTLTPTNIWLLSSVVFKGKIDIHSLVESASTLSGSDGNMTHCFFSQFFSSMMWHQPGRWPCNSESDAAGNPLVSILEASL